MLSARHRCVVRAPVPEPRSKQIWSKYTMRFDIERMANLRRKMYSYVARWWCAYDFFSIIYDEEKRISFCVLALVEARSVTASAAHNVRHTHLYWMFSTTERPNKRQSIFGWVRSAFARKLAGKEPARCPQKCQCMACGCGRRVALLIDLVKITDGEQVSIRTKTRFRFRITEKKTFG